MTTINPKLNFIEIDGRHYGFMWQDFGSFIKFTAYCNNKRIGWRDLSHKVERDKNMARYLIRYLLRFNDASQTKSL